MEAYGVWGWRMPNALKTSYDDLLAGLSPRAAEPGEESTITGAAGYR